MRLRSFLAVFGVVASIVFVAGLPAYVFPATHTPNEVDAILVLGPASDSRRAIAEELMTKQEISSNLVLSVPEFGNRSAEKWVACNTPSETTTTTCFHADPFTTLGEARGFSELAQQNGWTSVVVITATTHVTRARLLMERCYDGEISMVSDDSGLTLGKLAWQYLYQSAGFVKSAFVTTDCPKATLTFHDSNSANHPS